MTHTDTQPPATLNSLLLHCVHTACERSWCTDSRRRWLLWEESAGRSWRGSGFLAEFIALSSLVLWHCAFFVRSRPYLPLYADDTWLSRYLHKVCVPLSSATVYLTRQFVSCVFFGLDSFVHVLFAFIVLGLVSSVLRQEIGWEDCRGDDVFLCQLSQCW